MIHKIKHVFTHLFIYLFIYLFIFFKRRNKFNKRAYVRFVSEKYEITEIKIRLILNG